MQRHQRAQARLARARRDQHVVKAGKDSLKHSQVRGLVVDKMEVGFVAGLITGLVPRAERCL
jgi:hypothetical protein